MSDAALRGVHRDLVHPIVLGVAVVAAGLLVWLNVRYVRAVSEPSAPVSRHAHVAPDRGYEIKETGGGAEKKVDVPHLLVPEPTEAPALVDEPPDIEDPCSDEVIACASRVLPKTSSGGFRKKIAKAREAGDEIVATCIGLRYVDRSDPAVAGGANLEVARSWLAMGCSHRSLVALDRTFEVLSEGEDWLAACAVCAEIRGEPCSPCMKQEEVAQADAEEAADGEAGTEGAGGEEAAGAQEAEVKAPDEKAPDENPFAVPVPVVAAADEPAKVPEPTQPADTAAPSVAAKFYERCSDGAVTTTGGVTRLAGGWCYYLAQPNPAKGDYTITFEARLVSGNGYGIWFNGAWDGSTATAPGVQYDRGAGGLKFVDYPDTERSVAAMKRASMNGDWHRWVIRRAGDTITVSLDDVEVAVRTVIGGRRHFGLRTWNSAVELRGATVTP